MLREVCAWQVKAMAVEQHPVAWCEVQRGVCGALAWALPDVSGVCPWSVGVLLSG